MTHTTRKHYGYVLDADRVSSDGRTKEVDWFYRYKYQVEGTTWVPVSFEAFERVEGLGPNDILWFICQGGGRALLVWRVSITTVLRDPIQDRVELWFEGETKPMGVLIETTVPSALQLFELEEKYPAELEAILGVG